MAVGTIGAPISMASRPAPRRGSPSDSGSLTLVPSGNRARSPALAQDLAGRLHRVVVGLAPAHREGAEADQDRALPPLEELVLAHEAEVPAGAQTDEERVPEALVVGGDDGGPVRGDVLDAGHVHPEVEPEQGPDDGEHDRVEDLRDPLLSRVLVGFLVRHPPAATLSAAWACIRPISSSAPAFDERLVQVSALGRLNAGGAAPCAGALGYQARGVVHEGLELAEAGPRDARPRQDGRRR